jgi:drug/metabolite transporter (DMT)-like permease
MKRWQADGAIVGAGALWGLSYIFTRWGLEHSPPAMFLLGRFSLALVVTLALFGSRLKGASRRTIRRGLIMGGLMGGGALLQAYSVNFTDVSRAAFIIALTMPATPLASFLLFREKVSRYSLAGVVLSLIGLYLLLDPRFTGLNVGDLLAILSIPLWALFMIYMNIFTEGEADPDFTAQFLFLQFLGVVPLALLTVLVFESGGILPPLHPDLGKALTPNGYFWAGLVFCALAASLVTVFIQTACQKYTTPVQAIICFQSEPVVAMAAAVILLGETVTFSAVLGAAIIIGGVLASELGGRAAADNGF